MAVTVLAVAIAAWPLLVVAVLALCTAAAKADEASAACQHADEPFTSRPDTARAALLCEIERVRERRDRSRLRTDGELDAAAGRHSADMVQRQFFSHVSPGGGELADRLRRSGYARARCSWRAGEVLAWGAGSLSSPAATVKAWMGSPGHRRVLVSRRYREIGAGLLAGTPTPEHPSGVTVTVVLGDRNCSP